MSSLRPLTAAVVLAAGVNGCSGSSATTPAAPETPPAASTPAPASSPTGSSPPLPTAPEATAPALPSVTVTNIGMHIGGGPNDAVTKEPIARSVAPHFDELRACWAKVDDPKRGGDLGVDLLIEAQGGAATVSNPRTGIHPDAFRACVVDVFERVDFARPRGGRTKASYSLRFTP